MESCVVVPPEVEEGVTRWGSQPRDAATAGELHLFAPGAGETEGEVSVDAAMARVGA